MSTDYSFFYSEAIKLVGKKNFLTGDFATSFYKKGFRFGGGDALAVITPTTLLHLWHAIKLCHKNDFIIIFQAANTGLTGGSSPYGDNYDREIVIINTLKLNKIFLINGGKYVLSFPGTTLYQLEKKLASINCSPHSVIGSSQIGATVVGGIANNSGGALVKRGPAYTEFSLFAQIDKEGNLNLINHLGMNLKGENPEEIINQLDMESFDLNSFNGKGMSSDQEYINWIRDINSNIPSRFNADERRLYEASGCAGKLGVFAVITETFPMPKREQIFYLGTNNIQDFSKLRKDVLSNFTNLPDISEYMHRNIFLISKEYAKDVFFGVKYLGTNLIPKLFKFREFVESFLDKAPILPKKFLTKFIYFLMKIFPEHLPNSLKRFSSKYEHHLIISASDKGIEELRTYLESNWGNLHDVSYIICSKEEGEDALLHRFAAGAASGTYAAVHDKKVEGILALDIALPRNDFDWEDNLPEDIQNEVLEPLYYGHFLCNVFHRNYILRKGADKNLIKKRLLSLLDNRGAKYPAEHNVGHLYNAEKGLKDFYLKIDPTNSFNPGIGGMEKGKINCNCCL